jgi:hypothetical protein
MSALSWKEPTLGQAKAVSHEPIVIYEVSRAPISKRRSQFQVQVTTETGAFVFPRGFRSMSAARQACQDHLNRWRRKTAQQDTGQSLPHVS